jgi:hypothetical protein
VIERPKTSILCSAHPLYFLAVVFLSCYTAHLLGAFLFIQKKRGRKEEEPVLSELRTRLKRR